jgi:predicted glycoside hydrolase/deacetylase ChbG (UPF0249 family)
VGDAARDSLVIVNADDLGVRPEVTGAILECWLAKRISSSTAMVHMADSARAAELAREHGLPVGLHLNLTTPYTDPGVPRGIAQRQAALVALFRDRRRRWLPAPRHQAAIAACIGEQLTEFTRLYGRGPTHVDGHEHIQCSPTVFLSRAVADVPAMRLAHTFVDRRRPWGKRQVRRVVNAAIRMRFRTTGRFWSLRDLHPALGGRGLESALDGTSEPVELMVHPAWADERAVLLSAAWAELLAGRRLGSYESVVTDARHAGR